MSLLQRLEDQQRDHNEATHELLTRIQELEMNEESRKKVDEEKIDDGSGIKVKKAQCEVSLHLPIVLL